MSASLSTLQLGFIVSGRAQPASGSERYYWDLLRALPAQGVGVRGLVVGDPGANARPIAEVASVAPEGGGALERVRSLRRAVADDVCAHHVVVSHQAQQALPVLDLIRRRPFVVHFHGPLVREGRAERVGRKNLLMRSLAERAVYPRAQRIVALSRAFARFVVEDYGVAPERVRVIPGAVDLDAFATTLSRAEARAQLGWPSDRPTIVAVRRLAPTKGLEELVDAAPLLARAIPDASIVIVGAGPLRAELERRVDEREAASIVRFAGRVDDALLPLVYRAADCTVVPSVALEGFGLVVVESLACGTPALVTPVAGLPEVVTDLAPELILERADAAAIADGLAGALSGTRPIPDAAACAGYAARFDWRTIAGRIAAVYREVI